MAGATAVGVGSAIYYRGPQALREIANEIDAWMLAHGLSDLTSIRGIAHLNPAFDEPASTPPVPTAH